MSRGEINVAPLQRVTWGMGPHEESNKINLA
jgi:hypothetical protein